MSPYLAVVLIILIGDYLLELVVELLNLRHSRQAMPEVFNDCYDADRYAKSQDYLRINTRFGQMVSSAYVPLLILFIVLGGFATLNDWVLRLGWGTVTTGVAYGALVIVIGQILQLPIDIYRTFRIEARFGFNRTTPRTFVMDRVKGALLFALIGAPIFALVIWFFSTQGPLAWFLAWAALAVIQCFMLVLAPVLIMPLFNRYEPLPEGELRSAIEDYARTQNFALKGVYQMDGSRRSAKSNAFFTGFGRFRRIVLFDTLIEKHSVEELLSVVAHEMGHYKRGHITKGLVLSLLSSLLTFYVLSLFIGSDALAQAFGLPEASVYAGLIFFGFLYQPVSTLIGVLGNVVSRKHEFEADAFAARTTGSGAPMIAALKKLSADNLGNLTPHPLKVFLEYSHPPVLARINALQQD